jgi:hypothetical protein
MLGCLTLCLEGLLQWVDFMAQPPKQPASSVRDASDEAAPATDGADVEWLSEDEYRRRHGGDWIPSDEYRRRHGGDWIPIDEYRLRKAAGENLP